MYLYLARLAVGLALAVPLCSFADEAIRSYPPQVLTLKMPPVSIEEAEKYLNDRRIPESDFETPQVSKIRSPAPVKIDVQLILGHALSADSVTEMGFPRADFAIAHDPKNQLKESKNFRLGQSKVQDRKEDVLRVITSPAKLGER